MLPSASPSYLFGQRLAAVVNGLEEQHDRVLFWCIRFDDRVQNRLAVRFGLLVELQRLRANLATLLPEQRLAQVDGLLAAPAILDQLDPFALRAGYFSRRSYLIRRRPTDEPLNEDVPNIYLFGPEPEPPEPAAEG